MREKKRWAFFLVAAIVLGFAAGVVGELWINSFLLPELQFKDYRDLTARLDELTAAGRSSNDSGVEVALALAAEKVGPATVDFYFYKKSEPNLAAVYSPADRIGAGAILTNDGWILTTAAVIADPRGHYAVRVGREIAEVREIVADSATDAVFVKIAKNNLPVVEFGSKENLTLGESLLVFTGRTAVARTAVADLNFAGGKNQTLASTEFLAPLILLNEIFENSAVGAPVADGAGKVAGILLNKSGEVLPIDYLAGAIGEVFSNGKITRVFFGARYLDLDLFYNYFPGENHGAALAGDRSLAAVIPNSPAARAGLKSGDIITKVENEVLGATHSLASVIQEYKPGTSVNITFLRGGKEQTVDVKLENL